MTLEIFSYGFMQRALVSGIAIALLCSVVGLFLVLRRYSLFGDAVAHSSFGGIAAGLLIGIYPMWTAYVVSLVSALVITRIKQKFDISGEASVAILLSSGIAIGLILISLSGGFNVDILSFLFGSILLVSVEDTVLILGLTVIILIAGITVVTSIQLVGILLISALFVIPNVTAIMYGRSFKQTALLSIAFAVSSVIVGILISYLFDITPSGTIVMLSVAIFAVTIGLKWMGLIDHSKMPLKKLSLSNHFI